MKMTFPTTAIALAVLVVPAFAAGLRAQSDSDRVRAAQDYFRGIYGGDSSVVDELAGDEIVVSYPIFERLFGTGAIRGREAVKGFVVGFGKRWADPEFQFHDAVAAGDRVVLVWSFSARSVGAGPDGAPASGEASSWGGITLFRFDAAGKIVAEIGEESEPGPIARLRRAENGD